MGEFFIIFVVFERFFVSVKRVIVVFKMFLMVEVVVVKFVDKSFGGVFC